MKHQTRIIASVLFVALAGFCILRGPNLQSKKQPPMPTPSFMSTSSIVLYLPLPVSPKIMRQAEIAPLTFWRPIKGLGPTPLHPSVINQFPIEEDGTWGKRIFRRVDKEMVPDIPLEAWLQEKLAELVAVMPDYPKLFAPQVKLYRDPRTHNAYGGGGGCILMSLETIAYAAHEEAVMQTLGHELGHNALRHATSFATFESMLAAQEEALHDQMQLMKVKMDAKKFKLLAFAIERLQRNRDDDRRLQKQMDEMAADVYGIQALYRAGYDARKAVADYWERSKSETPRQEHYDAHPNYAARALRIELETDELASTPTRTQVRDPERFARVQARARALIERRKSHELPLIDPPTAPR